MFLRKDKVNIHVKKKGGSVGVLGHDHTHRDRREVMTNQTRYAYKLTNYLYDQLEFILEMQGDLILESLLIKFIIAN